MKDLTLNDYFKLVEEELNTCKRTCPKIICYNTKREYIADFNGFYHGIFVCVLHNFGFLESDKFFEDCIVLKKEYDDFLELRVRR